MISIRVVKSTFFHVEICLAYILVEMWAQPHRHQPNEIKSPHNENIAIEGNKMKLPKLALVRFAKSREVEGRILNATIRRNPRLV
ncbi:hypothetical protein BW425_26885 [Bacillus pseudomycoides]|uniref:Uncharacterized protein n=1 Tax=Bacillus pseudomycoides TaxID=64104 RepID=A0A1Y3MBR6_9BACI|nr:hypothetical protein BW425_26885 [Bacillus pseudomycoides]